MAESLEPAQSHSTRQFCEESPEIKWLCFNCQLYLCQLCNRRIHSKQKASQNHKVISLRDLNPEEAIQTRQRVDLENLTCESHKDQKCVSFCLDCKKILCLICYYEEHQNHDKIELTKHYTDKLVEIQKEKQNICKNLCKLDSEETKLTKMSDNISKEYKNVKDDIDKKEAEIIAEAKKCSQKLHNDLDKVYHPVMTEIQNNLSEVQQMKVQLKEKKDNTEKLLQSYQAKDVIDFSKTTENIHVPVLQQLTDFPTEWMFKLRECIDFTLAVKKIFADLELKPNLIKSYLTELHDVNNIINCNKNEKLISSWSYDKLQRVSFENDSMTVIKEEYINVCDMALMENGDVVISSVENELQIYTKEGTIKPYKSFHPLYTLGVHVNKHNELLVGLTDEDFNVYDIGPDSIRKIVVLNQSGDIQHTYQYTRDKQRLFTWPDRIISCQDTICVVDTLNDSGEGRIVALDYGGHVQWVYNGKKHEGKYNFYPTGMTVISTDLILVADHVKHAIHVLNPRGQVIVCHQVEDLGVEYPLSLYMDNEGLLWVGCFGVVNYENIHTLTIM